MIHSLYGRLTFLMLMILVVTGSLALYFSSNAINQAFIGYIDKQEKEHQQRLASQRSILPEMLTAYFEANPENASFDHIFDDLSWLVADVILPGPDGIDPITSIGLPASSQGTHCESLVPISSNGEQIAQVCFYNNSSLRNEEDESLFYQSIQSSLLWALLVSGLLALLLNAYFLRPVLRPLGALTRAARKVEQGQIPPQLESASIQEIQELTEAFNAMSESIQHVETLRRNLVSDVAHELRTPLTNMRGYLEAIEDGLLAMNPKLLESLHEEVMLLARLVDDLQDLALAEAGQLPIHREPVNLSELISSSVQLLNLAIQDKAISLDLALATELPLVEADRERIGQVLRNLLTNALAHTPKQGKIRIEARQMGQDAEIRVSNSGQGIDPQHLPYVFERFYRADKSRTRITGGYGLGLAIVKQLVEAHGGHVGVQSSTSQYTSFFFTLPLTDTL
ncbi:MAG: HAMP domain-containing sensor histidine kinase [Chloroflexota bacterium]